MVLTLELPIRRTQPTDPLQAYEKRFGALPYWFDEIDPLSASRLARLAVSRGTPLAAADHLS